MKSKLLCVIFLLIFTIPNIHDKTPTAVEASTQLVETISSYNGTGSFGWPFGMYKNDTVFAVADAYGSKSNIVFFNHQNEFLTTLSVSSGPGNFSTPYDVVLTDQFIGIVDYSLHVVRIFDTSGNYQFSLGNGTNGASNEEFSSPEGITANETHFLVADTQNNRVQIFDINGVYSQSIGVNSPTSVELNGTHIFIVSSTSHRVFIYNNDGSNSGQYIGLFQANANRGGLDTPHDISFDPISDFIYVTEENNQRVSIFKPHPSGLYFDFIGYVGYKTALDNPDDVVFATFSNGTHIYVTISDLPFTGYVKIYKIEEGDTVTSITTQNNIITEEETETLQETITDGVNSTHTTTKVETQPTTIIQETTIIQPISDDNESTIKIFPVILGVSGVIILQKISRSRTYRK